MVEERTSYTEIKDWLLSKYFRSCRDRAWKLHWTQSQVLAAAYEEYAYSFELPIEKLMLETAALVLTGNWMPNLEQFHRREIMALLQQVDFEQMVQGLPAEEAEEFLMDWRAVMPGEHSAKENA